MAKSSLSEFISIAPTSIASDRVVTFEVYLYLAVNERSICILNVGDIPSAEQLSKYLKRGVNALYIKKSDKGIYEEYLAAQSKATVAKATESTTATVSNGPETVSAVSTVSDAAPTATTAVSVETVAEKINEERTEQAAELAPEKEKPIGADPNEPAKEYAPEVPPEKLIGDLASEDPGAKKSAEDKAKEMIKDIMKDAPEAAQTILAILENPINEHATSVAIYSVLISLGLGKRDQGRLQDLIIASLLHDVGFTQLDPELAYLPRTLMTPDQRKEYETHVNAGLGILGELGYKPTARVLTMLSQHHEKFNGSGFPNKLESFRVDEDAQFVEFSDLVDSLCRGRHDGTKRELNDALTVVAQYEKQTSFPVYFNPSVFRQIMNWVKSGTGKDHLSVATNAVAATRNKMLKTG